ncbi:hypothetical protein Taro_029213 [Colocasia esculenta]|uniref:Uncharacterized protein n=1 Tax=Colocasia esculenta TaxID=4460 RepID=A0A843VNE9_COLES|nr:hypothetical protein [Colocasia esculenta]
MKRFPLSYNSFPPPQHPFAPFSPSPLQLARVAIIVASVDPLTTGHLRYAAIHRPSRRCWSLGPIGNSGDRRCWSFSPIRNSGDRRCWNLGPIGNSSDRRCWSLSPTRGAEASVSPVTGAGGVSPVASHRSSTPSAHNLGDATSALGNETQKLIYIDHAPREQKFGPNSEEITRFISDVLKWFIPSGALQWKDMPMDIQNAMFRRFLRKYRCSYPTDEIVAWRHTRGKSQTIDCEAWIAATDPPKKGRVYGFGESLDSS